MGMERQTTRRGFAYYRFTDHYGAQCPLQKSSLATAEAIWFGVDDVPHAARMHLTREQVKTLLPILQCFVDTGEV